MSNYSPQELIDLDEMRMSAQLGIIQMGTCDTLTGEVTIVSDADLVDLDTLLAAIGDRPVVFRFGF